MQEKGLISEKYKARMRRYHFASERAISELLQVIQSYEEYICWVLLQDRRQKSPDQTMRTICSSYGNLLSQQKSASRKSSGNTHFHRKENNNSCPTKARLNNITIFTTRGFCCSTHIESHTYTSMPTQSHIHREMQTLHGFLTDSPSRLEKLV